MGGCTRSSPANSGQMRAEQISPLPPGSLWHVSSGLALHSGPGPPARSPQRPRLTSRPATCQLGLRTGERLHPDDIGVPRVGGKNLTPGAFARNPRPLDLDALHFCHLLGRSLRGRADGSLLVLGPALRGRYEHAPGTGVTLKCPRGWKSSAAGQGTQKRLSASPLARAEI